jgi:HD-GYP domain-containing protein (c-di-GMP phosphodiesterase class II)
VAEIAADLAELLGLDDASRATLHRAALLHDVGKLGISSLILNKPGELDPSEWEIVRNHPKWSMQILSRVSAFGEVARIAAAHHERLDGSGYHRGLTGDALDQPSRILAVADVAEALSADRPYRAARDPDAVLATMRQAANRGLDPDVVGALREVLPSWWTRAQAQPPAGAGVLR